VCVLKEIRPLCSAARFASCLLCSQYTTSKIEISSIAAGGLPSITQVRLRGWSFALFTLLIVTVKGTEWLVAPCRRADGDSLHTYCLSGQVERILTHVSLLVSLRQIATVYGSGTSESAISWLIHVNVKHVTVCKIRFMKKIKAD
jgi:hypothetical protein